LGITKGTQAFLPAGIGQEWPISLGIYPLTGISRERLSKKKKRKKKMTGT